MNDCLLSIIIPLYNAEETIKRCVDSVVQQDMPNYEVLLVNDGSTDASGQICDEYAHDYPQVQTFHQPNNGVSAARNIGLDNARGNYVMFIDSDDYLENGVLNTLSLKGDIVFFEAKKLLKDKSTKIIYELEDVCTQDINYRESFIKKYINTEVIRVSWAKFIRRSIIKDIRFNVGQIMGEDTLFMLQVMANCKIIQCVHGKSYVWRDLVIPGCIKYRMDAAKAIEYVEKIYDAYRNLGVESDEFEYMLFNNFYSVCIKNRSIIKWYHSQIIKDRLERKFLPTYSHSFIKEYNLWRKPVCANIYINLRRLKWVVIRMFRSCYETTF